MKKKIMGVLIPFFVAIVCGYGCGKYVFSSYYKEIDNEFNSKKLYLVLNGEYDSYDKMREDNNYKNFVYYKDGDKYVSVVGITKNYKNIDKIKMLYDNDLEVLEYFVNSDNDNEKILEYDNELLESDDYEEIEVIVNNILNLYDDMDTKLVYIN